jgi:hypothetical protein
MTSVDAPVGAPHWIWNDRDSAEGWTSYDFEASARLEAAWSTAAQVSLDVREGVLRPGFRAATADVVYTFEFDRGDAINHEPASRTLTFRNQEYAIVASYTSPITMRHVSVARAASLLLFPPVGASAR